MFLTNIIFLTLSSQSMASILVSPGYWVLYFLTFELVAQPQQGYFTTNLIYVKKPKFKIIQILKPILENKHPKSHR